MSHDLFILGQHKPDTPPPELNLLMAQIFKWLSCPQDASWNCTTWSPLANPKSQMPTQGFRLKTLHK